MILRRLATATTVLALGLAPAAALAQEAEEEVEPVTTEEEATPLEQLSEAFERRVAVAVLRAVFLRLDHDPAAGDARVFQDFEPLPQPGRKVGPVCELVAQVYGGRHLVHVLAAGPARAHGRKLDVRQGNREVVADAEAVAVVGNCRHDAHYTGTATLRDGGVG